MNKIIVFIICVISFECLFVSAFAAPPLIQTGSFPEHEVLSAMRSVCDWQIANNYDADFTWHYGALLPGITATSEVTKEGSYMDAAVAWSEKFNWQLRERSGNLFHADDHCCGQTYLDLYMLDSPDPSRYADAQSRMDNIIANPQTFSCTTRTGKVYDWCDALFMAPPVWTRLSHITGNSAYINEMHDLWMDSQNCLYNDDNDHDSKLPDFLWWRDKNYIASRNPDGTKIFWGRGNGWVAGGLVRVLQFTPSDDTNRSNYITILQQMANALKDAQQPDGFWRSNILYPEQYPNPETSGTSFFTYMMAYGINEGLLDPAVYGPVIEAAWEGLVTIAVHPDGKLGYVQPVGAGPAAADYESTQVYGVGGFLMAGSEMYKYYHAQNPDIVDNFESYSLYNSLKPGISETWKAQAENGTTGSISLEGIANQNLRLDYDNSQSPYIAETYRDFSTARDFTKDPQILTFYLKGQATNAADEIYCRLVDSHDQSSVQRITDTSLVQSADWVQINLDLSEFTSIDLTEIKRLVIGVGYDSPSGPTGAGTIWVDEIGLSSLPPVVVAGDDLLTFLTEGIDGVDVTMDASVVDGDTTENRWAVVSPAGVTNFPKFSVEDPLNVGADVNVTVTFYEAGVYTLTLTADDGEADPVSDSLVVTVYANSCAADKAQTPYTEEDARLKGDTNYDCKVNLVDFAAMAENWLIDVSLSL